MLVTKKEAVAVLEEALAAAVVPAPACGCGWAYVCLTGPKEEIRAVAAAAKVLGLKYLGKAYGTCGKALYMGYDNADGYALGKAKAVEATLKAHGVGCYVDAVAD